MQYHSDLDGMAPSAKPFVRSEVDEGSLYGNRQHSRDQLWNHHLFRVGQIRVCGCLTPDLRQVV